MTHHAHPTTAPSAGPAHSRSLDQLFQSCVHCGLCLEHCPTYVTRNFEPDSPRGRILLMRGLHDARIDLTPAVQRHLDLCLDCRACETACPSGVRYGRLIEHFRTTQPRPPRTAWTERLLDYLLYEIFPDRRRLARWLRVGQFARAIGATRFADLTGLSRLLPPMLDRMQRMLPDDDPAPAEPLRAEYPAAAPRRRASFFVGCVGEAVFPHTNRASLRVLNASGASVDCPASQTCCGAIHHHGGRLADALRLARANIDAFPGSDPIVTSIAGCGAMLKQYGALLADDSAYARRATDFSRRVQDISEFVADAPPLALRPLPLRVTYHDPCHLCHAQGIRRQPRDMLRRIPGLQLVDLPESELCCGAAGTYNLTQPEMSATLALRKLDRIRSTGASVVATGNAGCLLQLRAAAREHAAPIEVIHPIDLLDKALSTPA